MSSTRSLRAVVLALVNGETPDDNDLKALKENEYAAIKERRKL